MSRLIDADFACKGCIRYRSSLSCEECVVNDAPTVDAVPVVRCRECKHRRKSICGDGYQCCNEYYGMASGVALKDDDFCSYGERKEGAD